MAISELILGTGVALLIALLGWGNQIRDFQNDTKQLEMLFAKRLGTRYRDINRITSKINPSTIQDEFVSVIRSVGSILKKNKAQSETNLVELNKLSEIENEFEKIKKSYDKKYQLTLELSVLCVIFGIGMFIIELLFVPNIAVSLMMFLIALIPIVWIFRMFILLIEIHKTEVKFQENITDFGKILEA